MKDPQSHVVGRPYVISPPGFGGEQRGGDTTQRNKGLLTQGKAKSTSLAWQKTKRVEDALLRARRQSLQVNQGHAQCCVLGHLRLTAPGPTSIYKEKTDAEPPEAGPASPPHCPLLTLCGGGGGLSKIAQKLGLRGPRPRACFPLFSFGSEAAFFKLLFIYFYPQSEHNKSESSGASGLRARQARPCQRPTPHSPEPTGNPGLPGPAQGRDLLRLCSSPSWWASGTKSLI